jgi:hypothetical protein
MKFKLPIFKKKDKRSEVEKERDAYVAEMWAHRDNPEVYGQMCANVEKLANAAEAKRGPNWVEVAKVGIPIVGTGLICLTNLVITKEVTHFEETDVITSRAPQMRLPWK